MSESSLCYFIRGLTGNGIFLCLFPCSCTIHPSILFPRHECNIRTISAEKSQNIYHITWKETVLVSYRLVLLEDTRSALWGLPRMNSSMPVMIPRGAGSIPGDDRTGSGSHTSLWCGRHERNTSRLRWQEPSWREGISSKHRAGSRAAVRRSSNQHFIQKPVAKAK